MEKCIAKNINFCIIWFCKSSDNTKKVHKLEINRLYIDSYFVHTSQYFPIRSQLSHFYPITQGAIIQTPQGRGRKCSMWKIEGVDLQKKFNNALSRALGGSKNRKNIIPGGNQYVYEEEPDSRYAEHRWDARCHRRVIWYWLLIKRPVAILSRISMKQILFWQKVCPPCGRKVKTTLP